MGGARILDLDRKPDEIVSGLSRIEIERQQRDAFTPIDLKVSPPADSFRSNSFAIIHLLMIHNRSGMLSRSQPDTPAA